MAEIYDMRSGKQVRKTAGLPTEPAYLTCDSCRGFEWIIESTGLMRCAECDNEESLAEVYELVIDPTAAS